MPDSRVRRRAKHVVLVSGVVALLGVLVASGPPGWQDRVRVSVIEQGVAEQPCHGLDQTPASGESLPVSPCLDAGITGSATPLAVDAASLPPALEMAHSSDWVLASSRSVRPRLATFGGPLVLRL
ncbi:MAG: hypothetical protein L0Y54_11355 [Sporichthyaceae bacterium]|nr:hypothetical protein [Sporichthyaceae bacterium]